MKKKDEPRVTITRRALIQRVNRVLAKNGELGEVLRKARSDQATVGDWFIVDLKSSAIFQTRVDPEALGRKLGVVKPYEAVEEES